MTKTNWTVTLKVIARFDRDVKLNCYKLKYIEDKGIVVSGYSVPYFEEFDGENVFIPFNDIYKIEKEAWSEWGITRTITYLDHTWKDEVDRMLDRMERRFGSIF